MAGGRSPLDDLKKQNDLKNQENEMNKKIGNIGNARAAVLGWPYYEIMGGTKEENEQPINENDQAMMKIAAFDSLITKRLQRNRTYIRKPDIGPEFQIRVDNEGFARPANYGEFYSTFQSMTDNVTRAFFGNSNDIDVRTLAYMKVIDMVATKDDTNAIVIEWHGSSEVRKADLESSMDAAMKCGVAFRFGPAVEDYLASLSVKESQKFHDKALASVENMERIKRYLDVAPLESMSSAITSIDGQKKLADELSAAVLAGTSVKQAYKASLIKKSEEINADGTLSSEEKTKKADALIPDELKKIEDRLQALESAKADAENSIKGFTKLEAELQSKIDYNKLDPANRVSDSGKFLGIDHNFEADQARLIKLHEQTQSRRDELMSVLQNELVDLSTRQKVLQGMLEEKRDKLNLPLPATATDVDKAKNAAEKQSVAGLLQTMTKQKVAERLNNIDRTDPIKNTHGFAELTKMAKDLDKQMVKVRERHEDQYKSRPLQP